MQHSHWLSHRPDGKILSQKGLFRSCRQIAHYCSGSGTKGRGARPPRPPRDPRGHPGHLRNKWHLCVPPPAPRHGPAGSPGTAPACPGVSSIAAPGIAPTLAGPLRSGFGCRIMVSEQPRAFLYTIPPFAPPNYVVLQSSGRGSHGGAPGARRWMGCQQDPSAGCCGLNASQGLAQGKKKEAGDEFRGFSCPYQPVRFQHGRPTLLVHTPIPPGTL